MTETPAIDSGSDVWQFTDEPDDRGIHLCYDTRKRYDSDSSAERAALDIDSELLAYAEIPVPGSDSGHVSPSRDVLTENRYAHCSCCEGMDAGQHALQQYERKRK